MTETKTPIARESLENSWESLSETVFKLKSQRDALLKACIEARRCINHYGIVGDPASFMLDAAIADAEGGPSDQEVSSSAAR